MGMLYKVKTFPSVGWHGRTGLARCSAPWVMSRHPGSVPVIHPEEGCFRLADRPDTVITVSGLEQPHESWSPDTVITVSGRRVREPSAAPGMK